MTRKARPRSTKSRPSRPRSRRLILACAVAFAILLLLVRMLRFVHGRGRR